MVDAGIVLCDEYTQDRSVESVHAVVAGAAASAGGPARRRGAAAGRVAGGADTAVWQGWLSVRGGRTAWPVYLFRADDGWSGAVAVRAARADRGGAPLRGHRDRGGGGAACSSAPRWTSRTARFRRSTPSCSAARNWGSR